MTRRSLLPLLLVCALAWSCTSLAVAAATVNGDKITEAEVEAEIDVLREDPIFGEALRRDPDARGVRRREILSELIYQRVAEQEAERFDIRVTDKQIQSLIERSARAGGLSVEEFLEQERLSPEEAERLAERGVRRFALIDEVAEDIRVDEETAREVYEGQREAFVDVHLERITVPDRNAARSVLERLDSDESFSDIARDVSTDEARSRGGDLGYVAMRTLDVQVQSAVGQAVEGDVTDPIESTDGAEIYRLVDRRTRSFEEVEGEIQQSLVQSQREQAFEEWLVGRVRDARVVVNPKYGSFDKQSQRPTVVQSTSELRP